MTEKAIKKETTIVLSAGMSDEEKETLRRLWEKYQTNPDDFNITLDASFTWEEPPNGKEA